MHTRAAARALSIFLVGMLTPFLLHQLDWSRPGRMSGLILLTVTPFLVSFKCLRFLGRQEAEHATPTPEMSFIFGLAISVPLTVSCAALIVLNP